MVLAVASLSLVSDNYIITKVTGRPVAEQDLCIIQESLASYQHKTKL